MHHSGASHESKLLDCCSFFFLSLNRPPPTLLLPYLNPPSFHSQLSFFTHAQTLFSSSLSISSIFLFQLIRACHFSLSLSTIQIFIRLVGIVIIFEMYFDMYYKIISLLACLIILLYYYTCMLFFSPFYNYLHNENYILKLIVQYFL